MSYKEFFDSLKNFAEDNLCWSKNPSEIGYAKDILPTRYTRNELITLLNDAQIGAAMRKEHNGVNLKYWEEYYKIPPVGQPPKDVRAGIPND